MKLIFASNNLHKLQEVRAILAPQHEVIGLSEIGCHEEIEETGETLEENSLIKAQFVWNWLHERHREQEGWIFADDTGLEIEALDGKPGVRTARWAGDDCLPGDNRKKTLREMNGISNRKARFRTVITLISNGLMEQVEGEVLGTISTEEAGNGGFGYDPVFIPEGYDKTFAELPIETKNDISHRARAVQALKIKLAEK